MTINNKEIEIKFKIESIEKLREKLKENGAQFRGKAFQKTFRFDTHEKKLEKMNKFLRVRTGFKKTLTLKEKIEDKNFKKRKETELEIEDPKKMTSILKKLGFTKILIMEKNREKWFFKKTEIVIDELPMGKFIEIEGSEDSIEKVIKILNLDSKKRILGTYWDLWRDFKKKNNLKGEDIIFEKDKK
jgi:predicted adenylyl cyclase CyaB